MARLTRLELILSILSQGIALLGFIGLWRGGQYDDFCHDRGPLRCWRTLFMPSPQCLRLTLFTGRKSTRLRRADRNLNRAFHAATRLLFVILLAAFCRNPHHCFRNGSGGGVMQYGGERGSGKRDRDDEGGDGFFHMHILSVYTAWAVARLL